MTESHSLEVPFFAPHVRQVYRGVSGTDVGGWLQMAE